MLSHKIKAPLKYLTYRVGQTRLWTHPDRMYLESTNVCNLQCVMCPNGLGEMGRPKGFMDFELFRQIVDEMAPHLRATTLHIWGEPLLHPQIYDMVAYCRRAGLSTEISTNAVLLTEEASRKLLESGLGVIYMCLDGTKKETYEKIRRRGDFERTRENIRRFVRLKCNGHRYDTQVNIQLIEMLPTREEAAEFKRIWTVPGVDRVHIKAFDSWANQIEQVSDLKPEEPKLPDPRFHCPNLWFHVHIYWDGTLVCCDRDFDAKHPLGNVSSGVMRAWNGRAMQELRRKHLARDLDDVPSCSRCVEWSWWRPAPLGSYGNAPQERES